MIFTKKIEKEIIKIVNDCVKSNTNYYEQKIDKSIVTNVDRDISNKIKIFLSSLFSFNYICEEDIDNIGSDSYIIIDPLDGTENFISGLPIYGFSLCYYKNGLQYSLLYFPAFNLKLSSLENKVEKLDFNSRIVALSSYLSLEEISKLEKKEYEEYRIIGCATYNIYCVITGKFKAYVNPRINSWDIFAGIHLAVKFGKDVYINGEKYNGKYLQADKKYSIRIC